MQDLINKVKTCHGYDIYELTEEESITLRPGGGRCSATLYSFFPDKTYYIFEQGENLTTSTPVLKCRELPRATTFCRHYSRIPSNNTLSIEDLKNLPLRAWVWIECLQPFNFEEKTSAYYRKHADYDYEKTFFCGYPGLTFGFDYADYGVTWEAYKYCPRESTNNQ